MALNSAAGRAGAETVELSVVVPVYGCAGCLARLHARLQAAVTPVTGSHELIFVDDRSVDGSWEVLLELARVDPAVRLVRLSRNFGQHAAITAGIAEARGEWTVVMDCDLEDPPEEIPRLLAKARAGYDIVFARRRQSLSAARRGAGTLYYWLLKAFLRVEIDGAYGNLSIVSRKVADAFLTVRDVDRSYPLILSWLGFEHAVIDYDREPRHAGTSAYSFSRLARHAVAGVFFQTSTLLRWIVYLGFALAALGALLAVFLVCWYFAYSPPQGWTSLAVLLLVLGGFIIISTGVTGLYIGRIFTQVKGRPLYVVDTRVDAETLPLDAVDEAKAPVVSGRQAPH